MLEGTLDWRREHRPENITFDEVKRGVDKKNNSSLDYLAAWCIYIYICDNISVASK